MNTSLIVAEDARRLFGPVKKGDVIEYPFRSERLWRVVEIFPDGNVGIEEVG